MLQAGARAAGRARDWVAEVLERWGSPHRDDALLVVSELVTNAVLHAGGELCVVLVERDGHLRLEVIDELPRHLPTTSGTGLAELLALDDDLDALEGETMTGRGLLVVDALADAWGVDVEETSKAVWAAFGVTAAPAPAPAVPDAEPPEGANVRFTAVPARLILVSAAQLDDLVREFRVAGEVGGELGEVAGRFLALTAEVRQPIRAAAHAAVVEGRRLVDVSLRVTPEAVTALEQLLEVLERIAEHSRSGAMLSLAPGPELVAFRRWYAAEIRRQVDGGAPRPSPFPTIAGDDPELTAAVADVTARLDAEGVPRRQPLAHVLPALDDRLAAAASEADAATAAVDAARIGVDATAVSLCLVTDDGLSVEVRYSTGHSPVAVQGRQRFGLWDDLPASEAIRTGAPVVLRTAAEREARFPALHSGPGLGDETLACIPVGGLGALALSFRNVRRLDAPELEFLAALARSLERALVRLSG